MTIIKTVKSAAVSAPVKVQALTKARLARILGIDQSLILETEVTDSMKMFSCSVPAVHYLDKLVPKSRVALDTEVINKGQRNHIDRSKSAQAAHVQVGNPPPQQASIDVVIRDGKVVNLDGYHRTLYWHNSGKLPFKNIRLTVYVESKADKWEMLDMYEVYDSPKAVRRTDHKVSAAYRLAGILPELTTSKMRLGKGWSALKRLFPGISNNSSVSELARRFEADSELIIFLETLMRQSNEKIQNVELFAFGQAFRDSREHSGRFDKVCTLAYGAATEIALGVAALPRSVSEVAALYDLAGIPHPAIKSSRSGEKALNLYGGALYAALTATLAPVRRKRKTSALKAV